MFRVSLILVAILLPAAAVTAQETDVVICTNPAPESYQRLSRNGEFQDFLPVVQCDLGNLQECWVLERALYPSRMACSDWTGTAKVARLTPACFASSEHEWQTPSFMTCTWQTQAGAAGSGVGPTPWVVGGLALIALVAAGNHLNAQKRSGAHKAALQQTRSSTALAAPSHNNRVYQEPEPSLNHSWGGGYGGGGGNAIYPAPDELRCQATTLKGYQCERYATYGGTCWQH